MKATEILVHEHEIILGILDVIDAVTGRIDAGGRVDTADLGNILDIIVNFADRCHHAKEEGILFPAMVKAGFPDRQGPIAVMLHEHEVGRGHVKAMKEALAGISSRGDESLKAFALYAAEYAALLRNHIYKENNMLFKMADDRLDTGEQDKLFKEFEKVEREKIGPHVHERYHEMANALARKYLG